jgi:DNA-binding LacI/PurR family transcriptional regulator
MEVSAVIRAHQPVEAIGRKMVRLLLTRIAGEEVGDPLVVLPTHLVVRGSA